MKDNSFSRWWLTPYYPEKHIDNLYANVPQNFFPKAEYFIKNWVLHPLKRRVAKYYLIFLRNFFGVTVIGITGSAGKTTTKEMLASILKLDGETVFSYANIDPIYNIPTTILRSSPRTKYLILEMGVEYPGEMDFYLWLARPDMAIITNINPTHIEYFKNIEGVFREKSKLVKFLNVGKIAVLNRDDKYLSELKNKTAAKIVWFGKGGTVESNKIKITRDLKTEFIIKFTNDGMENLNVTVPTLGLPYVSNALGAAGAAKSIGILPGVIKTGLEKFTPPPHRMQIIRHNTGATIFDDSYNNNPAAAKATIRTFCSASSPKSRRIIVFGDMLELGDDEEKFHRELGNFIATEVTGLTKLICVGKASKTTAAVSAKILGKTRVIHVLTENEATPIVKKMLGRNTSVLIKGSRSIGLDKLVSGL